MSEATANLNQFPQEGGQPEMRETLSNSFSDLDEDSFDYESDNTQKFIVDLEVEESDQVLIRKEESVTVDDILQSEVLRRQQDTPIKSAIKFFMNKGQNSEVQQESDQISSLDDITVYQQFEEKYLQKIKVVYCFSILGSERVSPSNLKKLKTFLFIPKYGQELVTWGNSRFGTNHSLTSALERLEYIESSECSHYWVKLRENLKYVLLILLLLIGLRMVV